MRKQRLPHLIGLLPIPVLLLCGCSDNPVVATPASAKTGQAKSLAQQLKDIDNNPNMPPAAKEAAKANLTQHQGMDLGAARK